MTGSEVRLGSRGRLGRAADRPGRRRPGHFISIRTLFAAAAVGVLLIVPVATTDTTLSLTGLPSAQHALALMDSWDDAGPAAP